MYPLGHSGITLWSARKVEPKIDWRLPVFLALLPDLIDKPIAWIFPAWVNGSTRGYAHTFLAWVVVALLLAAFRRRWARPWLLWACFAGHAVLDMMWTGDSRIIFAWPLLGPFPPPRLGGLWSVSRTVNACGEVLGLALLVSLLLQKRRAD